MTNLKPKTKKERTYTYLNDEFCDDTGNGNAPGQGRFRGHRMHVHTSLSDPRSLIEARLTAGTGALGGLIWTILRGCNIFRPGTGSGNEEGARWLCATSQPTRFLHGNTRRQRRSARVQPHRQVL